MESTKKMKNLRWNWTLVANGARSDTLNDRFAGMWSAGSGPDAVSVVRFSAVRTVHALNERAGLSGRTTRHTVEHDDFMRRINVQDVVKRPNMVVGVQGGVRTRVVCRNWCVGESGN